MLTFSKSSLLTIPTKPRKRSLRFIDTSLQNDSTETLALVTNIHSRVLSPQTFSKFSSTIRESIP